MKKLLFTALCVIAALTASAAQMTVTMADLMSNALGADRIGSNVVNPLGGSAEADGTTTYSGFTFGMSYKSANPKPTWYGKPTAAAKRFLAIVDGQSISVSAPANGTITKIVMPLDATALSTGSGTDFAQTKNYPNLDVSTGTVSYEETQIVWTGSAESVKFTVNGKNEKYNTGTSGRLDLTSLILDYTAELPVSAVPEITPASGTYPNKVTVTMTAAAGAKIYYIDSANTFEEGEKGKPTPETGTLYTAPVTFETGAGRTVIVNAIAVEEGKDPSACVRVEYELKPGENVNSISDFLSKNNDWSLSNPSVLYTFTGGATVVYQNGPVLYVQDNTGGLCIQGAIDRTYEPGDFIADFSGTFASINGRNPGLRPIAGTFAAPERHNDYIWTDGVATSLTKSNISSAYVFKGVYVGELPGAENPEYFRLAAQPGQEAFTVYNGFSNAASFPNTVTLPNGGWYNMYGFVSSQEDEGTRSYQVLPIRFETFDNPLPGTVTITPAAGTYDGQVNLTITGPAGASIYYTTDGSEPTVFSTPYGGPQLLVEGCTVRAMAVANGYTPTAEATAAYTINVLPQAETPFITPAAGTYKDEVTVTISADVTSTVYYTLDGSEPTAESTLYNAPFTITESCTVKAVAVETGKTNSEVAEAAYVIEKTAPAPVDLYVRGTVNDWNSPEEWKMATTDNVTYTLECTIPAGAKFKVGSSDWETSWGGQDAITITADGPYTLVNNKSSKDLVVADDIDITEVTLNTATGELTLKTQPSAGISTVNAAEGAADVRYYDLQGRRILAPAAGTAVIRVAGNKAEKIVK